MNCTEDWPLCAACKSAVIALILPGSNWVTMTEVALSDTDAAVPVPEEPPPAEPEELPPVPDEVVVAFAELSPPPAKVAAVVPLPADEVWPPVEDDWPVEAVADDVEEPEVELPPVDPGPVEVEPEEDDATLAEVLPDDEAAAACDSAVAMDCAAWLLCWVD